MKHHSFISPHSPEVGDIKYVLKVALCWLYPITSQVADPLMPLKTRGVEVYF